MNQLGCSLSLVTSSIHLASFLYDSNLPHIGHNALTLLLLLLCLSATGYYGLAIYAASAFFSQPPIFDLDFHPPISILKPICGSDRDTYANLASFCQQDYPTYQVIFGVQDPEDSSIPIVKQLIQDFPIVEIHLVICDRAIGMNRKINNLANAEAIAKYSILLLADSDIRVQSDYLQQVVQPLHDQAVGIVTCLYRSQVHGWLATFESLSVTTEFLPSVFCSRMLEGMRSALGATIVIRRSVLAEIGGFSAIANCLVDDFELGNLVSARHPIILSRYIVDHVMAAERISDVLYRQIRWVQGIRFTRPLGYVSLIFTHGTVASLLLLLITGGALWSWVILGITGFTRLAMAAVIGVKYLRDPVATGWLWLVPLRDLVSFAIWCYCFTDNKIQWRGQQFHLISGGKLLPL
jgi:ceramide glucosyltransferase